MKIVAGYIAAVLSTYILGAAFISQGNIAKVVEMGFDITIGHRIDAIVHDVTHMYDIYLPVIAVAMLIALPVAAGIIRFVPNLRLVGYLSAGFVGMIAIHFILKMVVGVTGIAPTREITGLIAQGLAGGVGGYLFYRVTQPQV